MSKLDSFILYFFRFLWRLLRLRNFFYWNIKTLTDETIKKNKSFEINKVYVISNNINVFLGTLIFSRASPKKNLLSSESSVKAPNNKNDGDAVYGFFSVWIANDEI